MRVYHRTDASKAILQEGFRDGKGTYGTGIFHQGAWISNYPLTPNEGAFGDVVLCLDIPEPIFENYEWVGDEKPFRESLIPAEILNKYKIIVCTEFSS